MVIDEEGQSGPIDETPASREDAVGIAFCGVGEAKSIDTIFG